MKNLDTSPELNVGMRATKLQKSTEKTTRQQVGSATNSQTHTNSLSPLSLSLHCEGLAGKEKEDSAKRFPYRNGDENAMLQTVMCGIRHRISRRNGQNALQITQPPVLPSYPHNSIPQTIFCNFSKTITM